MPHLWWLTICYGEWEEWCLNWEQGKANTLKIGIAIEEQDLFSTQALRFYENLVGEFPHWERIIPSSRSLLLYLLGIYNQVMAILFMHERPWFTIKFFIIPTLFVQVNNILSKAKVYSTYWLIYSLSYSLWVCIWCGRDPFPAISSTIKANCKTSRNFLRV